MTLYSLNGKYPEQLPFRIRMPNGNTRTDPTTFSQEEIAAAGYVAVDDMPICEPFQLVYWSHLDVKWMIRDKNEQEIEGESNIRRMDINSHRDLRIASGFTFQEKSYDSRPEDQKRISGAAQLAFMAIVSGAQPGDYLWASSEPFGWIAQDNTITLMDAQTVVEFAKVAAEWERHHIFAARTLKDMQIVPEDYRDDKWWPTAIINSQETTSE